MIGELRDFLTSVPASELDEVAKLFGVAARQMVEYGFKVLQIHAAHGYLISQLLMPALNRRADEYGGDPLLLLKRCIAEVRAVVRPGVIVDVRVSGVAGDVLGEAMAPGTVDELVKSSDMVSISAGHYELSRDLIYPSRRDGDAPYLPIVNKLAKAYPQTLWNCAGNIRKLTELSLLHNMSVSIGRPLLADPEFVEKNLTGQISEIVECDYNGACHYYTRGLSSIVCPLSPDIREL